MTDELEINETYVRRRLLAYADAGVDEATADHGEIAQRARARSTAGVPLGGLVMLVLVIGAVLLIAPSLNTGSSLARSPAGSCAAGDWPTTAISCDAAFRLGNQAGAGVKRARIWLTTLGAVKSTMAPAQQVSEPAESADVWVIVYDGFWRCCPNGFDESGNLIPEVDQTRWLVVAEAAREGAGFVYLQDWSGRAVPDRLPSPPR
jgi:hypothetical protein